MEYYSGDYFTMLKEMVLRYTWGNYDYCYLKAMHERNRTIGTETIIAGSSHAMNGIINENITGGCINFSVSSQDIYFDFLHIKKAMEEGVQKIKNCIINIGYYTLYTDLSYSNTGKSLIWRTYYPIFNDSHHYVVENEFNRMCMLTYDPNIYSYELVKRLCEEWSNGFFLENPSFYGNMKTREENCILGKITWSTLDAKEKESMAIKRTDDHNSLRRFEQSRIENSILIKELAEYLHERGIKPIFVIFPFTTWYNRYINKDYRPELLDTLESVPYPVEFLDMNDYEGIFDDSDFMDTDHLNKQGAVKATKFLNEFMQMIAQEG